MNKEKKERRMGEREKEGVIEEVFSHMFSRLKEWMKGRREATKKERKGLFICLVMNFIVLSYQTLLVI